MQPGQRCLLCLMALGGMGWIASGVDYGYEDRPRDGCELVGTGAGQICIVDRDGFRRHCSTLVL